jgi:hypothetical protein
VGEWYYEKRTSKFGILVSNSNLKPNLGSPLMKKIDEAYIGLDLHARIKIT